MLPLLALIAVTSGDYDPPPFAVLVDRTRREVVLRIGPSHVPSAPPGMDHHTAYSAGGHNVPILQFAWPVSGWIRGYRLGITDAEGRSYTSRFLHHLNLLHLDRALLFDPVFERTIAIGQETADVRLPSSVGIRVDEGSRMGVHIAFANETGEDRHGVVLELRISYIGEDVVPRPTDIRPIVFDIGFRAGYGSAFDLPAGRSVHERVFTLPMDGRLLGAGGHLHQYAESLTLEDVETGKRLVTLRGIPDSAGLAGVTRKVLGVTGDGLRLKAGRTYRAVAVYLNPESHPIKSGGMAALVGIFAPDRPAQWPSLDRETAGFQAEKASLDRYGWAPLTLTHQEVRRRN